MNENQQELLNFIYQHNLSAADAARYVRDLDVPQEDKVAVMQDFQQREQRRLDLEQEERNKQELARQKQLKEDIDRGLIDMRAARDRYELASNMLDETGMFDFLGMETNTWLRLASPQRQFEAAKAAQAKAATELQAKFYEAGREDLAGQLGLPKSKWSRRVYTTTQATANGMLFDFAASISDNEWVEQQEKFYGDISRGIDMETQKTAGELVKDMGSALLDLDLAQFAELIPDLAEEGSIMLAEQAPYLALTAIPYAGIPLNFAARTSQAYQDIEDDPNLTGKQKAIHSFLSGGIESVGDILIGKAGGLGAGIAAKLVTPISSKLMSNALVRGAVKTGGVILGEGTSEAIQETLIMGSEKYVLGREEENVMNRLYESFVGGALVGGPLTGVRSLTNPTPAQLASRPGDPTHRLATEIAERIDNIIEQSENVEPNSPEAKALEVQLEDLLRQESERVGRSRDYYRKMRRRDRESYDRIIELDSEIAQAIIRSKSLKTDWGKDTAKKEIEALMEERNNLYKRFDEKGLAPMTTLERFEDAVEDIDSTIADIDADLESIEGLEPQNDDDLKLINDLMNHKSALRNKKKALQKALGDIQKATNEGDTEAIGNALANMEAVLAQDLPSESPISQEQLSDDITQDSQEPQLPPVPQPPTPSAPQQQEAPQEFHEFSFGSNISDDYVGAIPTNLIRPIKNLINGFRNIKGLKVRVHKTKESLRQAHSKKSNDIGFYDRETKTIHIHSGTNLNTIKHEFSHAMFHNLLSESKYRKEILNEVESLWGKNNVDKVKETYKDYPPRFQEEEVIAAFFERFGSSDGLNQLRAFKGYGVVKRLIDFFNSILNKKYGRYADSYKISNETELLMLMESFVAAAEYGSEIRIQSQSAVDADQSQLESRSSAYPDLIDKEVSYTLSTPGRYGDSYDSFKTVRIKDYWHLRNWWAKQTGNGKHNWINNLEYIGDNGEVKKIRVPSPKRDRDTGEIIDMQPLILSRDQRVRKSSELHEKYSSRIFSKIRILSDRIHGAPVYSSTTSKMIESREPTQEQAEELARLSVATKEFNRLFKNGNTNEAAYKAVFDKAMNVDDSESVSTNDAFTIEPNPNAKLSDDVSGDMQLEARSDEAIGSDLDNTDLVQRGLLNGVVSVQEFFNKHTGKPLIMVQYDKSKGSSGVGAETIEGAVTSHAADKFATQMADMIEIMAKKAARGNKEAIQDVEILVAFGLQKDSILSNPEVINRIKSRVDQANENEVVGAFEDAISFVVRKGKRDSIQTLEVAAERMFGSNSTRTRGGQLRGAFYQHEGISRTIPFPSNKQEVLDFLENIKKTGEIEGTDTSLRRTAVLMSDLLAVESPLGKLIAYTSSEAKLELERSEYSSVQTGGIVAFRTFKVKVVNADTKSPQVQGVRVVVDDSKPFKYHVVTDSGSEIYGLENVIPFTSMGENVKTKIKLKGVDKEVTVGRLNERLNELEANIKSREAEVSEAEASGDAKRISTAKGLLTKAKNQFRGKGSEGDKIRDRLRSMAQSPLKSTVPTLDITDQVFLDDNIQQESRDDVMNTTWKPRERTALQSQIDWARQKLQDKFAQVMMIQEDIQAARRRRLSEDQDFRKAEELMYGKAHNDLEKLEAKVESLKKAMADSEITIGDLEDYMYARHAAERNALLLERDKVSDGSGMSDEEAASVMDSFTSEQTKSLEKIAKIVDDISQNTRDTMRKFGLESDDRVDSFERMFKHYIPLGGIATDSKDADAYPYPTGGLGFHVKGLTTKRAKGRRTIAQDVVAQVISQNAAIHIKARKNEALQKLYALVKENPNTNIWNISDNVTVDRADNAVGVRINGEQKFIIFKDESIAKNLKGMGTTKLDAISRLMAAPANFLRAAFTTRNPEFIISNFSRDIQSAVFNALAEADIEDGQIRGKRDVAMRIIKRTPSTLKVLLKSSLTGGDLDPVMSQYLNEFKEDGGQTGWGFVKPLQEIADDLKQATSEDAKAKKAIKWMANHSLKYIEDANDAFENSIRLSAYIEARESGASRSDAAQLAKNITVNFNKSGEWGAVANAWYLFFNASIQGTARLGRSLINMRQVENPDGSISKQLNGAQRLAIGLSLASAMLALINMGLSDEDEDGELFYNKIPDYEKERNLIFMYDGKNYIKVPLPYGYNLFSNFGTALAETTTGNRDAIDAMWFMSNSMFSSFSPISFGQSENLAKYTAKALSPTAFKPLIEIAVNETYFGSKVHQEQFPVGAKRPESELSFRSPEAVKYLFQWINKATGGSEYKSGDVDINPDLIWYPFEYYIGGMGQFVTRSGESIYAISQMIKEGEKVKMQANDIPFLRKVYGEPSKYYDFDLYDSNKEQVLQLYKERKEADVKNIDRYNGIVKLDKKIKSTEKKLKALRKERRAAQDLPFIQRVNKSAELQEKERILIMEYNALHEKLRGQ